MVASFISPFFASPFRATFFVFPVLFKRPRLTSSIPSPKDGDFSLTKENRGAIYNQRHFRLCCATNIANELRQRDRAECHVIGPIFDLQSENVLAVAYKTVVI